MNEEEKPCEADKDLAALDGESGDLMDALTPQEEEEIAKHFAVQVVRPTAVRVRLGVTKGFEPGHFPQLLVAAKAQLLTAMEKAYEEYGRPAIVTGQPMAITLLTREAFLVALNDKDESAEFKGGAYFDATKPIAATFEEAWEGLMVFAEEAQRMMNPARLYRTEIIAKWVWSAPPEEEGT